jgi:hypothetical protein
MHFDKLMFRFFLLNAPSTTAGDVIGKWDGIGKYIVLYSIIKLLLKNDLQKKIEPIVIKKKKEPKHQFIKMHTYR